jgi:hypothetical protein
MRRLCTVSRESRMSILRIKDRFDRNSKDWVGPVQQVSAIGGYFDQKDLSFSRGKHDS